MQLRNDPKTPKHYPTHQNMSLGSNGVDWVRSLRKIQCNFVAQNLVLIEPDHYIWKQVYLVKKRYQMHPNTTKRTETLV